MLLKYRPEDRAAKKERLLKRAQAEAEGKTVEVKKPIVVKYGLNHVTYLIEQVCFIFPSPLDLPLQIYIWSTSPNHLDKQSSSIVEKEIRTC